VRAAETNRARERRRKRSAEYRARKKAREKQRMLTDPVYRERVLRKKDQWRDRQREERMLNDPAFREKMERLRRWHDEKLWGLPESTIRKADHPALRWYEQQRLDRCNGDPEKLAAVEAKLARNLELRLLTPHQRQEKYRAERRERARRMRTDPAYRKKVNEYYRQKRLSDPEYRERQREKQRKLRADPAFRERQRERLREHYRKPEIVERRRGRYQQKRFDQCNGDPVKIAALERKIARKRELSLLTPEQRQERRREERNERERNDPVAREKKQKRHLLRRLRQQAITEAVTELGLLDLPNLRDRLVAMIEAPKDTR
jgi:hypothetical protein